ncbi:hypothetical protein C8Q70DRAFT_981338 [Cubamyces menziesii]|nr:hypothetical protein C8Q70DRAFT_981338 [Cubamyces menziesii]
MQKVEGRVWIPTYRYGLPLRGTPPGVRSVRTRRKHIIGTRRPTKTPTPMPRLRIHVRTPRPRTPHSLNEMANIMVLAKLRGRAPVSRANSSRITDVMFLDLPILPTAPIRLGSRVYVCILTPSEEAQNGALDDEDEGNHAPRYLAESTNIAGRVTGIRAMEATLTELAIRNEVGESKTEYAYLTIPHLEGITVSLPLWMRILRWILRPLLANTRQLPIEPFNSLRWKPVLTTWEGLAVRRGETWRGQGSEER